jgi:hypothetical protein
MPQVHLEDKVTINIKPRRRHRYVAPSVGQFLVDFFLAAGEEWTTLI